MGAEDRELSVMGAEQGLIVVLVDRWVGSD